MAVVDGVANIGKAEQMSTNGFVSRKLAYQFAARANFPDHTFFFFFFSGHAHLSIELNESFEADQLLYPIKIINYNIDN